MKINRLCWAGLALLISPAWGLDSTALMDQVNNRYVGDDASSLVILEHTERSGKTKHMELKAFNRETADGRQTLLKFTAPSFMRDSGLLIHALDQDENLQWLFLSRAARREPRKIAGSEKGKPLFGTDIYYIDIEPKATSDFNYRLLEAGQWNERAVAVIESTPKKSDYPYSKTVSWVDTERQLESKVEFYANGELLKTLVAEQVEIIEDIWSITATRVRNHKNGSSTLMRVKQLDYNRGIDESQFSFRALVTRNRW